MSPDATLTWSKWGTVGQLRFFDPGGHPARITVTRGPSYLTDSEEVWHVEENDDGTVTISSQVQDPMTFRLVGALDV